jgi:hypothetical protein
MELSKKDKKMARELIEKGLQIEFANGLSDADKILVEWKNKSLNNRDHQLYKHIADCDKHIASRYDHMSGSRYIFIIAGQLRDNVITGDDLLNFSDEVKGAILMIADI